MRLTILGGGGFRVPLVYRALCRDPALGVDELVLHDVDEGRLRAVRPVLSHLAAGAERAPDVRVAASVAEAVRGADFVFSAVRVGGLRGRICDERAALAEGVIGQETTGAGGVCYGLRTVPEALRVADAVAAHAPDAWVINFTNPAGMVTEAMRTRLGDRVVGICDSPIGLMRRVAAVLGHDPADVDFGYAGLNHLGWLVSARVDGRDRLPDLLADAALVDRIEEGRLFGAEWLRTLGAIPNEYLWYWYFRGDALAAEQAAAHTRGELIVGQQEAFYGAPRDPAAAYERWEATRREREASYMAESRGTEQREEDDLDGGGYDRVALAVMRAVHQDRPTPLVLNVANRGALGFLDDEAVVEVPCTIAADGVRQDSVPSLDLAAQGLVTSVKAVERLTIQAAVEGSRELAVAALALHPLVGSVPVARRILARQLETLPELAAVLVR